MNILRIAALVVIFIKCVTTSTDGMSTFRRAVDEGNMAKAVELLPTSWDYRKERKEMFNYVVDKKDQEFIFNFAKQAGIDNKSLLVALHRKKPKEIIEEAFKVFNFAQNDLRWVASHSELMCSPNDLFNLLGKIEKQEDQEKAIENGVWKLFTYDRTECLDPLLNALEGNESFNHLKGAAIKKAFKSGSAWGNKPIVERFHDHPAITSEDYAQRLLWSGSSSTQDPVFIFLLGEADQDDLSAVQRHGWYRRRSDEFKKAIEDALLTAKPDGTRSTLPLQRAELVMKTFKDDSSMNIPTVISELIASYLVDESILKSITTPVEKTIDTSKVQKSKSHNRKSCIIS